MRKHGRRARIERALHRRAFEMGRWLALRDAEDIDLAYLHVDFDDKIAKATQDIDNGYRRLRKHDLTLGQAVCYNFLMAANDTTNEIIVIGYSEIMAGDTILAANGPNVWKGGAYNFAPLRPEPITDEFELDLYRSEEDGRSIFVVERKVAIVPEDADPCDTCAKTGGHFPHLCIDCRGWGFIRHETRGLVFSIDGMHDTNEERMGLR